MPVAHQHACDVVVRMHPPVGVLDEGREVRPQYDHAHVEEGANVQIEEGEVPFRGF
jgi:hypothetical protein